MIRRCRILPAAVSSTTGDGEELPLSRHERTASAFAVAAPLVVLDAPEVAGLPIIEAEDVVGGSPKLTGSRRTRSAAGTELTVPTVVLIVSIVSMLVPLGKLLGLIACETPAGAIGPTATLSKGTAVGKDAMVAMGQEARRAAKTSKDNISM